MSNKKSFMYIKYFIAFANALLFYDQHIIYFDIIILRVFQKKIRKKLLITSLPIRYRRVG